MTDKALRIVEAGDDVLRIDGLPFKQRDALFRSLLTSGEWLDVVPGRASLTVRFDPIAVQPTDARARLAAQLDVTQSAPEPAVKTVTIPISYDPRFALDLDTISRRLGRSPSDVTHIHAATTHRVDFLGFTPGFAYLAPETDDGFDIPRLERPRQNLPAGSIGVVGGTTGIYALAGPGGWPIIGRTPMRLFDPLSDEPAVLSPGMIIRFQAISATEFHEWSA